MSNIVKPFDSYKLWYYSGNKSAAYIQCYDELKPTGGISFYKDGDTAPTNNRDDFRIHYPISQFDDVIKILRYEKPLYLLMTRDLIGWIGTSDLEPVGEQE